MSEGKSQNQVLEEGKVEVEFLPGVLAPNYSNIVFINNSTEEFILDFGIVGPGREGVKVISSIALSPRNAKLLYNALGERLRQYEEAMGEIEIPPVGK